MKNIYLVGMMGSGKSITAQKLAAILGMKSLDLDDLIVERTGRSIAELFEKEGEPYFRARESALLKEAVSLSSRVIATGGGTILKPENVKRMRMSGRVVYLETSPEVVWQRVKNKKDRPLLKHPDPEARLRMIFEVRKPLYEDACHFKVTTDGLTVEAVAKKIASGLEGKK